MLSSPRRWQPAEPAPEGYRAHFPDLHPLVVQVLYNRGLVEPAAAMAFLEGSFESDDPFQLRGMDATVSRLRQAIREGELISVYGDFDTDGVTATALLVLTLRALGGQVQPYIPHRVDEGYGLNCEALAELAAQGVRVVVTVDCGIRSPVEVAFARQRGMEVIVTDHHMPGDEPLEALAVINPRQPDCPYPYKDLAGVGLAYKLAQALLRTNREAPLAGPVGLREDDLLDLVALGTVADLAPLTGENRALVIRGLRQINSEPRPGVEALMTCSGLRPGQVDAMAIGYALGPRLNAAGRIAHAKTAYKLLTTEYPEEAKRLAEQLNDLNQERQQLTAEAQERAQEIAYTQESGRPLLFIAAPDFRAGVVGLVASRLVEEFYCPVVIVEQGEETSRGSARSIPEFHITRALDTCADLLLQHGGHALAAGFTARTSDLPTLKARLLERAAAELAGVERAPSLAIDAEVPLREMSWQLWQELQRLQPFGEGNAEPLFLSRGAQVRRYRTVGTDGAHLKLLLSDGHLVWDAIAFWQGEWADRLTNSVDIVYNLQLNEWNGQRRLQLNVRDLRPML